jgi:hypothetical protein
MENNYKITPLTVEISVLKIGKKQCTIAVFKQLKKKNFRWDYVNDIEIWGEVYYSEKWYIIFSYNKEIYKCSKQFQIKLHYQQTPSWEGNYSIHDFKKISSKDESQQAILNALYSAGNPSLEDEFLLEYINVREFYEKFNMDNRMFASNYERNLDLITDKFNELISLKNLINEDKREVLIHHLESIEKLNNLIETFDNLPQLFIAV